MTREVRYFAWYRPDELCGIKRLVPPLFLNYRMDHHEVHMSSTLPPLKPITIQDIAKELGVHKSTVSMALSGKGRISTSVRERILTFANDIGYEPDPVAQRLANRSESRVVCLCSGSLDPGRSTEKIALIQNALTSLGLEVPFYTPPKFKEGSSEAQSALFRQLRRQRPQAIICSVHAFHEEAFVQLEKYQREGGIVISYDLPIPLACDQVVFDRADNAYQGVVYLLKKGHRNIGLSMTRRAAAKTSNMNTTQDMRVAGFRQALEEWEVPVHPEWIFENETYERGGAQMAQRFMELKERPTALCIVNDYVALAFMVELMRLGVRIPEDVSVVGHDNLPIAAYCPAPLTSISQPAEEIVAATVELLRERLKDNTVPPRTVTIRGHLIERQSVQDLT